ncbi:carbohydrate ABC transporter permease [Paenibacillus hamazuiensis]|uniref:carbohydrate ABC transporter permease n=1 Tax=Paenibacillus hamazuiensis TaxID=2936508 RepID=UPI00200F87CB|nr:carbohydrate ABC transporter permease [Paenibacillus hamazuiensis]
MVSKGGAPWLRLLRQIALRLLSVALMIYIVFPVFWLLISSFKYPKELFLVPPTVVPRQPTLEYFAAVLQDVKFHQALLSSVLVAGFTTLICLAIGVFGAYVFAWFRFRGGRGLYLSVLGTQMLPQMILLIPLFVLMRRFGLLYTYQGLILAYITFSLPYVIWMFCAFLKSFPKEIEEAGRMDGCTRLASMFRLVLPLSATGLVATGIFVFIGAWNEFFMSSVLTNSATKTLPIHIAEYIGEERIAYEMLFPSSIISAVPVLVMIMFFQKFMVRGLTEGAFK